MCPITNIIKHGANETNKMKIFNRQPSDIDVTKTSTRSSKWNWNNLDYNYLKSEMEYEHTELWCHYHDIVGQTQHLQCY